MSEPSDNSVVIPDSASERSSICDLTERRKVARYSFVATADVFDLRTQAHLAGRCSDLSMEGCYIDALSPFPADSALQINIQHDSQKFQAMAIVAYEHKSLGMGIKFTEIKPEFKKVLQDWMARLSGEPIATSATHEPISNREIQDADSNMRSVLNELITLLVRKKVMTEMEGAELLIQMFR